MFSIMLGFTIATIIATFSIIPITAITRRGGARRASPAGPQLLRHIAKKPGRFVSARKIAAY